MTSSQADSGKYMLFSLVTAGDIDRLRRHFSESFWAGKPEQPQWVDLLPAVLREDKAIATLLILHGVWIAPSHMAELLELDAARYERRVNFLKRCGAKPPAPSKNGPKPIFSLSDKLRFMNPKTFGMRDEWLAVLNAAQEQGAPETVIAGGALRDTYLARPVKDVDIFLLSRGSEKKNRKFLEEVFTGSGLEILAQQVYDGGYFTRHVDIPSPHTREFKAETRKGWRSERRSLQSWNIVTKTKDAADTVFNIIFIEGGFSAKGPSLTKAPASSFAHELLHQFDIGLCRIGFDGKQFSVTPSFEEDVHKKKITVLLPNDAMRDHIQRLVAKYPDFDLCPVGKELTKPLPAPPSSYDWY